MAIGGMGFGIWDLGFVTGVDSQLCLRIKLKLGGDCR